MPDPERCPLSELGGFYYGENIPPVCIENCKKLWKQAISLHKDVEYEEYPEHILSEEARDCGHFATETGNTSLQANPDSNGERYYGITERCMDCSEEIAEDSFKFQCGNN